MTDKTSGTVTQQVSYTYDALNQRLAKTVATPTVGTQTTRFVYDRGNVYLEFSGNNATPSTRYLYGPMVDQVLAQESNGQTTWMLADHLGSVRDLVNNSGTVVNHFTYDSFGQVVGSTGTVDTRYKFTGREYDSETGLYYYRARYFDAGVGRFIGQDPIGFGAGDSNLYRYVGNSPINNIDPSGLQVRGTYNVDSGDLELYDVSKPYKHARAKAFSGEDHTYRGNRMRNNSRYEAFGEKIEGTGDVSNKYLFAGEQFDSNLGDYYLRARYYDADSGRFTRKDDYEGTPTVPSSLHRYAYTENDGSISKLQK